MIQLTASNIMDVNNAYKALTGDTRQVPEPLGARTPDLSGLAQADSSFQQRASPGREQSLRRQQQQSPRQQPWHQAHPLASSGSSYSEGLQGANINHAEIPFATVVDAGELELDYTLEEQEELGGRKDWARLASPGRQQFVPENPREDTRVDSPIEQKEEPVSSPNEVATSRRSEQNLSSEQSNARETAEPSQSSTQVTTQKKQQERSNAAIRRQEEVEALPEAPTAEPTVGATSGENTGVGGEAEGESEAAGSRVATEL